MKNISKLIILLLLIPLLFGCDIPGSKGGDQSRGNEVKMIAKIVCIGEKIEVNVIEGEYGASGIYWVITGDETPIVNEDGTPAKPLKAGDKIEIIYGGQVMMSYPPQIVAKKIVVLKTA